MHHILKGGEDSIGALEAIQRVYFNIGSCSEQCWVNHLTDLRQLDPQARNFGQTPFDIGQCRRDCPNFRAIEDRLPDIAAFLFSKENHATDLAVARANELKAKGMDAAYTQDNLVAELDRRFGHGAVARGREVFAAQLRALPLEHAQGRRAARSRTATSAPSTRRPGCARTGWATTCRRW